jgi:hypothetical protein
MMLRIANGGKHKSAYDRTPVLIQGENVQQCQVYQIPSEVQAVNDDRADQQMTVQMLNQQQQTENVRHSSKTSTSNANVLNRAFADTEQHLVPSGTPKGASKVGQHLC